MHNLYALFNNNIKGACDLSAWYSKRL